MQNNRMIIAREVGMALAVLALYLLTLLLPLHQAAASQRDLAALGFENLADWSVCSSLASESDADTDIAPVKCPAAGLAKWSPVEGNAASLVLPVLLHVADQAEATPVPDGRNRRTPAARAPPAA